MCCINVQGPLSDKKRGNGIKPIKNDEDLFREVRGNVICSNVALFFNILKYYDNKEKHETNIRKTMIII